MIIWASCAQIRSQKEVNKVTNWLSCWVNAQGGRALLSHVYAKVMFRLKPKMYSTLNLILRFHLTIENHKEKCSKAKKLEMNIALIKYLGVVLLKLY